MFYMVPVYILVNIFIVRLKEKKTDELIQKLPLEFRDLITPFKLENNMKKIIMGAFPIILALYLQQVDVSKLYIKKWLIQKQQNQLYAYFMNKEDAVVLFSK
jgi:hypothetical protein